jgi:N-acetylglucosaminyl-diphospho-decaprenol L-rhamnosyltransferase
MTGLATYDMIIVNYRDPAGINRLIREAQGWTRPPASIVVTDNSGDYAPDPDLVIVPKVISSPSNPGYPAAINAGLELLKDSPSEFVLFATQESTAAPDALERLLACLGDHPEAGLAAPLLAFCSDPTKVFSAGGITDAKGRTYHVGWRVPVEQWSSRPDIEVDWCDGAFVLVRKRALNSIGGRLRDDFFLYFDDVDLGLRLHLAGWSVRLVPTALAGQEPGRFTAYLRVRNRVLFIAAFPFYFDQRLRFSLLEAVRLGAISLRDRRFADVLWAWRGLWDGLHGRTGKPPRSLLAGLWRTGPGPSR